MIERVVLSSDRVDADQIIGKKSGDIAKVLGQPGRAELIHRDDMTLSPG